MTLADRLVEPLAAGVGVASRLARVGSGSTLPGRVLETLLPYYVERKASALPEGCVVVSGSNGKTTTTAMLREILEHAGLKTASNRSGANLRAGVATALMEAPSDADIGVFETDEAALPSIVGSLRPRLLVLTNIVRDQLDRFGEPEVVSALMREAVDRLPAGASVVANADDPLLWHSLAGADPVGFGLLAPHADRGSFEGEPEICPECGSALVYSSRTFAHFGRAECARGCHGGDEPEVVGSLLADHGLAGTGVEFAGLEIELHVGGMHNAYNAIAAGVAAMQLGVSTATSAEALRAFSPRFGRGERMEVDGRPLHAALMKNPVGAGALIDQVASDRSVGAVAVMVSDNAADGRDISWIWDADFERLGTLNLPVIAAGSRARDVAVRLRYAGIDAAATTEDAGTAVREMMSRTPEGLVAAGLATYTAMLDLRAAVRGSRRYRLED